MNNRKDGNARQRRWYMLHHEEENARTGKWRKENPGKVSAYNYGTNRKGGERYTAKLLYMSTGIPGERQRIREKHGYKYRPLKQIVAPDSQIHHEWIPRTAGYTGVALVEKDQHMHGFIDVIKILEGKITLLTEEEIKGGD